MVNMMKDKTFREKKDKGLSFIFDVSGVEDNKKERLFTTFFVSRRKIMMKELPLDELKTEIRGCRRVKMIMIMIEDKCTDEVSELLNNVSKERGICSPVIEVNKAIMYFPELKYSDMGLLDYICKQNLDLDDYSLKMSGSSLIGAEIYV